MYYISGCSAVGSAPGLGARHRPLIMKSRKTPKSHVNTDFFGTILSRKILYKSGLTTCLTTYGNWPKNRIFFTLRGVAQLVARDVWDVDAAGSNPVTPTKNQPKTSYFDLFSAVFLYIFHKIGCFQLTTCLPDFGAFYWIFHGFLSILLKIPFLCLLRLKNWRLTFFSSAFCGCILTDKLKFVSLICVWYAVNLRYTAHPCF